MYENTNDQHYDMAAPQMKSGGRKRFVATVLALVVLVGGGYVLMKKGSVGKLTTGGIAGTAPSGKNLSSEEQKRQVEGVIASVGKLMLLPKDDAPVLARVEDPDALVKQQAFFTGAEKGDTLLIFPKAQRAILYSPSRNLIINSGPIIAGDQSGQSAQSQTPVAPSATTLSAGPVVDKKK